MNFEERYQKEFKLDVLDKYVEIWQLQKQELDHVQQLLYLMDEEKDPLLLEMYNTQYDECMFKSFEADLKLRLIMYYYPEEFPVVVDE